MKLFRHRRPSWKTLLGVTRAIKQIKRDLGITALMKPFRWWGNTKRRVKRDIGYESEAGRLLRNGPRTPGGCAALFLIVVATGVGIGWILA